MAFTEFKGTYELGIMASGALLCTFGLIYRLTRLMGHPKSRMFTTRNRKTRTANMFTLNEYVAIDRNYAHNLVASAIDRSSGTGLNVLPQDTPALQTMDRLETLGLGN